MNKKMVFRTIGKLMQITALLLLPPIVVAIIYGEIKQIFDFEKNFTTEKDKHPFCELLYVSSGSLIPEFGKFISIAPKPIGNSKVGSICFFIAR